MATKQINFRIDEDTRRLLDDIAYAEERSLTNIVQRALRLYGEESPDYQQLLRDNAGHGA